ncbi:MAG: LysM peptidoglycan-binding domain-containing protein [Treponemataceae bacterium]|nr:LysM peptidoglycan-binding domain-containing protein [Treponemataceae bacterium]
MKTIGIRLADGSFYSIMADGTPGDKTLGLTTVKDNQTRVIVDMYRSETGTMEDAEYIDSLQIENLVAHPRGVVDISLRLSLDGDNRLSADMVDKETGGTSNARISLVSRTIEERMEPAEYEVIRAPVGAAAAAVAGGGLLAAVERMNRKEAAAAAAGVASADDAAPDVTVVAGSAEAPAEDNPFALDDVLENPFSEDPDGGGQEPASEDGIPSDFAPPDFDGAAAPAHGSPSGSDAASGGTVEAAAPVDGEDGPADDAVEEAEILSDFELPDFDSDSGAAAGSDDAPLSGAEELDLTPPGAEDELDGGSGSSGHDGRSGADMTEAAVLDDGSFLEALEADDAEPLSDFELPDFDGGADPAAGQSEKTVEFQTEADEGSSTGNSDAFSDLEIPDFPEFDEGEAEAARGGTDRAADRYERDDAPSGGISFSGLYDKETAAGNSAADDGDDVKKRTKVPVVICVICAIICILATLLVLFILPSKYNLLRRGGPADQSCVRSLPDELPPEPVPADEPAPPLPEPEPEVVEAQEDVVIVVAEPEKVVPEPPAEPEVKPQGIVYKIKWGDTLWDIADAYYKNPWRYHMIARHNNIRDPDYIISGTTIELPAE